VKAVTDSDPLKGVEAAIDEMLDDTPNPGGLKDTAQFFDALVVALRLRIMYDPHDDMAVTCAAYAITKRFERRLRRLEETEVTA